TRIAIGIKKAPPPLFARPVEPAFEQPTRAPRTVSAWVGLAALAILPAVALLSVRAPSPGAFAANVVATGSVPLFTSVLDDYRRVAAGPLPGRARDLAAVRAALPFTFNVLSNPSLRLLAAWATSLAGEPAAVLAYRWNDRVVLQYFVTDELVFQSPGVRASLAQRRAVSMSSGGQSMLLWAEPEYGTVLVGDLTPREFATLRNSGRTP
ncbi:MAG: hypothetical protein ABI120_12360, partial [Gemmatimonadaceae bacterium]